MVTTEHAIQEIKERANIVTIVGRYVDLKRKSGRYWGLCPFHNEKTSSFSVHEEQQFFYCFGCHAKGDIFGFLQQIEGIGFGEALERLAEETGVELPKRKVDPEESARRRSVKERLIDINRLATDWFIKNLTPQGPGAKYLKGRGVSPEMVKTFMLGFAPEGWDNLFKELVRQGITAKEAEASGLVKPSQKGSLIDRFRNRVMFPIAMEQARVVGFGGRTVDPEDRGPKYMNSPESALFDKSNCLYGFHQAMPTIRERKRCITVEGNLDVVIMHQFGFSETVATLGTALTERHVRRLKRMASDLVLIYDGDAAGRKAAFGSLDLFLKEAIIPRVVLLPPDHDPDSYLRDNGEEAMTGLVDNAPHLLDVWIDEKVRSRPPGHPGVASCVQETVPVLGKIHDAVLREQYIEDLARKLNIEPSLVRVQLRRQVASGHKQKPSLAPQLTFVTSQDPAIKAQEDLITMLFQMPDVFGPFFKRDEVRERMVSQPFPELVEMLLSDLDEGKPLEIIRVVDAIEDKDQRNRMVDRLAGPKLYSEDDAEQCYLDCLHQLNHYILRQDMEDLEVRIAEAERQGDRETKEDLLLKKMEINLQLARSTRENLRLIEDE